MFSSLKYVDNGAMIMPYLEQLSNILTKKVISFGVGSVLETPFWSAVKTGTSKDYRDNWCVGFSDKYLVAVWVGNFDSSRMKKVSGVSGAGPSWNEIMRYLHRDRPSQPPAMPDGLVRQEIKLPWVQKPYSEVYLEQYVPVLKKFDVQEDIRPKFAFPANKSVLVRDPHKMNLFRSLFVRMTGTIPDGAVFVLDGKSLGEAKSPFRISDMRPGSHQLSLVAKDKKALAEVEFILK